MHLAIQDLFDLAVLPVVAIGNSGRDKTSSPGNYVEVLSVGAMNKDSAICTFSGGGTLIVRDHEHTAPDLVAPGQEVVSCTKGGGFESWNGTSMATPIVSGAAALMLELFPDIDLLDLREMLFDTCRDLGYGENRQGSGLIQIGWLNQGV